MQLTCFECQAEISGDDLGALGDAFVEHARAKHEWPFPDQGIRNYAEATQRLTGGSERLESIGEVVVEPVTTERIDDWVSFFEHDAFVGTPEWAGCFCLEPHVFGPAEGEKPPPHWSANRDAMVDRLRGGGAHGYLAYVDGKAAGWVNASKRSDYSLYRTGDGDEDVIGISCFIIAPPYRRHGLANKLLDKVLADAPSRGVSWVEAYPFNEAPDRDAAGFRGPRSMYDERGFEEVSKAERHTVVRRRV